MKNLLILSVILGLASCSSLVRSPQQSLTADLALLDRSFISALYLSGHETAAKAKKYIPAIRRQWSFIAKKYKQELQDESGWVDSSIKLSLLFTKLASIEDSELHDELEYIQDTFMDLRARNDIPYYLDHLYRFHNSMTAYLQQLPLWSEKPLSRQALKNAAQQMSTAWAKWKSADFQPRDYGLNSTEYTRLKVYMSEIDTNLTVINTALSKNNITPVQELSPVLKKFYMKSLLLFSDIKGK